MPTNLMARPPGSDDHGLRCRCWPASAGVLGEDEPGEPGAGGDSRLGEDLVEVIFHRAGAEEELSRDLPVGGTAADEPGDLQLLGGQPGEAVGLGRGRSVAQGAQLAAGALSPRPRADRLQRGQCRPEGIAGLGAPPGPPQGLAEFQLGPGALESPVQAERFLLVGDCFGGLGQQPPAPGQRCLLSRFPASRPRPAPGWPWRAGWPQHHRSVLRHRRGRGGPGSSPGSDPAPGPAWVSSWSLGSAALARPIPRSRKARAQLA